MRGRGLKAEYLYAGFGAEDFLFSDARSGVTRTFTSSTFCRTCTPPRVVRQDFAGSYDSTNGRKATNEAELHTLKIGLNYHF